MTRNIRIIHWIDADLDHQMIIDHCRRLRSFDGNLEAECYQNLHNTQRLVLLELWSSSTAYAAYWHTCVVGDPSDLAFELADGRDVGWLRTEIYPQQMFSNDGYFIPNDSRAQDAVIAWPSRGMIRLVILGSEADLEGFLPLVTEDVRKTVREPGCIEYEWCRSIEFETHQLLLELWQSQATYDSHWELRRRTGSVIRPLQEVPRRVGSNGVELYNQESFIHLYDRWLPRDMSVWSDTVFWAR